MNEISAYIQQYGDLFYLVTFIWTALEGETFVIFAALAAQKGLLNIWMLFLAAWWGSFCGDQVYFFLGRKFGTRILARYPKIKPKTEWALKAIEKYHVIFILSYRFMYGVRNVSGLAVGLSSLTWRRFAILNLIAAFVWSASFCGAGYLFGNALGIKRGQENEAVDYTVREITLTVLGLFVMLVLVRLGVKWWQNRKLPPLEPDNAKEQSSH